MFMELVLAEMSVTVHKTVLTLVPWAKKGLTYICCCGGQEAKANKYSLSKLGKDYSNFPGKNASISCQICSYLGS
jgi:hypothetical protein